jgi:O-acetyl-ADP-ribose deacetylase (regulator of RNase III)
MKLFLKQCNILDVPADILVCSANVSLNLTGGVGADIIQRYGTKMQEDLHNILKERSSNFAQQGEVIVCHTEGLPYKAILHAVAVDPLYKSSTATIELILGKIFAIVQTFEANSIALTALATGFGNLSLDEFADGLLPYLNKNFDPIREIIICQIEDYRFEELKEAFPKAEIK